MATDALRHLTAAGADREARLADLRRMRVIATSLLALMAAIFLATSATRLDWPWLDYLRAFAEAGMVGLPTGLRSSPCFATRSALRSQVRCFTSRRKLCGRRSSVASMPIPTGRPRPWRAPVRRDCALSATGWGAPRPAQSVDSAAHLAHGAAAPHRDRRLRGPSRSQLGQRHPRRPP